MPKVTLPNSINKDVHLDIALLPFHLISPAYLCLYLSLCEEKRVGVSLNTFENVIFSNGPLMNILIFPHQGNNFHSENSFWDYLISSQRPLLYSLQAITLKLASQRQTSIFF